MFSLQTAFGRSVWVSLSEHNYITDDLKGLQAQPFISSQKSCNQKGKW